MRIPVIWIQFDVLFAQRFAFFVFSFIEKQLRILLVSYRRQGIDLQSSSCSNAGFFKSAQVLKQQTVPTMTFRIVRIKFDGKLLLTFHASKIVVIGITNDS